MKRLLLIVILISTMPMGLFATDYNSLWRQERQAEQKDLPKAQQEVLQKIVDKATRERAYGHLLKAALKQAQVTADISPDSLRPAVIRLQQQAETVQDEVLKTVYATVLYRVSLNNPQLELTAPQPQLTPDLCEKLARVKTSDYEPLVIREGDSQLFGHDLLSLIGYTLDDLKPLLDYYCRVGNRRAACIVSAGYRQSAPIDTLDALLNEYGDLAEAGELAVERYYKMADGHDKETMNRVAAEKVAFIDHALQKWGSWPRMNELRNERQSLTAPRMTVNYDLPVVRPLQSQKLTLNDLRHLSALTLRIYKVKADASEDFNLNDSRDLKRLKSLLEPTGITLKREYPERPPYESFNDSLTIDGLPTGLYLLEFSSTPTTEVVRRLYYVTDVFTICESQPGEEAFRIVTVSATTGQPIAGAHLLLTQNYYSKSPKRIEAVADDKGEYLLASDGSYGGWRIWAYTDADKACPAMSTASRYSYYHQERVQKRVELYSDRAIYRPGQTVRVAALCYRIDNGLEHQVLTDPLTLRLRDANHKVVAECEVTPDDYGVAATEFTLPSAGLNGTYTIETVGNALRILVEEYKRPAFHVDFPEVTETYQAGDTLTVVGTAQSYAGVPVQWARVSYRVERRVAFWWWSYSRYWNLGALGHGNSGEEILTGTAVTDADGHFEVKLPLTLPETAHPMFYHFVVTADVTDEAGETHSGQLSLPLGNRRQALSVDLSEKVLRESNPTLTFHLLNAAGKDVKATVRYQIDGGKWQAVDTNVQCPVVNTRLTSGQHMLKAVCEGDTLERRFVVFSLDDERPATETDDWFFCSDSRFPGDGSPVTLQVGSSAEDMYIVYSIFAGKKVIERGAVRKSNALWNRKLTYRDDYGNGLLLTFAWVKNGKCYTHTAQITRPVPDKQLRIEWNTFRDRLTPGQQEEWTLTVRDGDGKPADAQLMATLYDQSLDQLATHQWSLVPDVSLPLPYTTWNFAHRYGVGFSAEQGWERRDVKLLTLSHFDTEVFPVPWRRHRFVGFGASMVRAAAPMAKMDMALNDAANAEVLEAADDMEMGAADSAVEQQTETSQEQQPELRENLQETAFFYPRLTTDGEGRISLKFTLPESLTTWRFMAIAHTKDLHHGQVEALTVARKDVMLQPNMPRFVRQGDEATVSARLFNTTEATVSGRVLFMLRNPETDAVIDQQSKQVTIDPLGSLSVSFSPRIPDGSTPALLVCQMSIQGDGFSDGEQHYLPVLPIDERVTVTVPVTQHEPGEAVVSLASLVPHGATNPRLTLEYTTNPAWLMVQALPSIGTPSDDNAISLAAAYYANSLGAHIIGRQPEAKRAFQLWKQEEQPTTLTSQLEKNQELKDLLLSETPWVMEADDETGQRQRLADFFDENLMQQRLATTLDKLGKLQLADGAWTWWNGMSGSIYMTVAVSEMLVRLRTLTGSENPAVDGMLNRAFGFMGCEVVSEVKEMKRLAKEGHKPTFPSFTALRWLYLCALDGRQLPADVRAANDYLMPLLKKDIRQQSLLEKAMTAVILQPTDPKRSREYVQSLKEYTVYREDIGRYYDSPRATYSWFDYRIPTQTMVIEALQRITPADRQTVMEMQRWLLLEKRTQAWDTPISSVNAIHAFMAGSGDEGQHQQTLTTILPDIRVDGQSVDLPKATAALGYVKTQLPASRPGQLTIRKTSEGTSWGAVYAQFMQPSKAVEASASGITVERELVAGDSLTVGSRVKVRIVITADRDLDFVSVVDRRAACMEPVSQLSGYHMGCYRVQKDNATHYYFHQLSKGRHVVETEYYVDRAGTYETGTCTAQCAYAPEFRGTAKAIRLIVNE